MLIMYLFPPFIEVVAQYHTRFPEAHPSQADRRRKVRPVKTGLRLI